MRNQKFSLLLLFLNACTSHLSNAPLNSQTSVPATYPNGMLLLNPQNTRITFVGSALLASHEGTFTRFSGQITGADSFPQNAKISVEIDLTSVFTEIPLLTKHLKDRDFFDVEHNPEATFASTAISKGRDDGNFIVTGNLSLHRITKPITFPAEIKLDPNQISFDAKFTLRQSDFNMESARTTTNEVPVTVTLRIPRH